MYFTGIGPPEPEAPPEPAAGRDHGVAPGCLLVASPGLVEPEFERTVLYVVEHNDAGTLAVKLNRPSDTAVCDVLPHWDHLVAAPGVLFVGGPVKRDAALCIAVLRSGVRAEGNGELRSLGGRLALLDLDADPARITPLVEGIRIFAGYCGWLAGDLGPEIERNDWIVRRDDGVVQGATTSPITADPTDLWAQFPQR
ncbi:putative transcriptional regulator [Nocardia sp. GAS34]